MIDISDLTEIPDFAGYYASPNGKIYTTLAQGCRDRYNLSKRTAPREMSYRILPNGYARVYMRRESTGKREDVYIHRIIAELFIPNPRGVDEVNHLDCNRLNNVVSNLEWVTRIENLDYAFTDGFMTRDELGRFCNKLSRGKKQEAA